MNKESFGDAGANNANKKVKRPNYNLRRFLAATAITAALVGGGFCVGHDTQQHETGSFEMTVGDDRDGVIHDLRATMEANGLDPSQYRDLVETGQDIQQQLSATGDPAATSRIEITTNENGFGWKDLGYQFPGDKTAKIEH